MRALVIVLLAMLSVSLGMTTASAATCKSSLTGKGLAGPTKNVALANAKVRWAALALERWGPEYSGWAFARVPDSRGLFHVSFLSGVRLRPVL